MTALVAHGEAEENGIAGNRGGGDHAGGAGRDGEAERRKRAEAVADCEETGAAGEDILAAEGGLERAAELFERWRDNEKR